MDVEIEDFAHEGHLLGVDCGCAGVGLEEFVAGAETCESVAVAEGKDLFAGEGRGDVVDVWWVEADVRAVFAFFGCPEDSHGVVEFFVGEKSGLAVADGEAELAVDVAVGVEEEHAGGAHLGVVVDVDVVFHGVADFGQAVEVGEFAAEEAVDAFASVFEVCAHPGDEEEVGLAGFDHDAGWDVVVLEKPGVGGEVGFGVDGAGADDAWGGGDAADAVGE